MKSIADEFERIRGEFAQAVLACRARPGSKAVHHLRKLTRIAEALLRKATEDHPNADELHRSGKKASRELKRIRRAAGPVRDLDVHRKIAKKMCVRAMKSAAPRMKTSLLREYEQLDTDLSRRREDARKELSEVLSQREVKLERALEKTAAAMQELHTEGPGMLATAGLWVRRTPLPAMDPESLHDYRKKTKAARYLAGMDKKSIAASKLEKRLKLIQDAIGKWHDLLLLTAEAKQVLGSRAPLTCALRTAQEQAHKTAVRKAGMNQ